MRLRVSGFMGVGCGKKQEQQEEGEERQEEQEDEE